jgi:hypothetical protein
MLGCLSCLRDRRHTTGLCTARLIPPYQIYGDGSVRVAYPGSEMGQGLSVKVLQTAAYALSQV